MHGGIVGVGTITYGVHTCLNTARCGGVADLYVRGSVLDGVLANSVHPDAQILLAVECHLCWHHPHHLVAGATQYQPTYM